jgi:hypothetical protein
MSGSEDITPAIPAIGELGSYDRGNRASMALHFMADHRLEPARK